jgi:hypothetical protein
MTQLPDGWQKLASRRVADGSTIVVADRMEPVDLGPRKRNMFQRFGIFRLTGTGTTVLEALWEDRAGAFALFDRATR